MQRYGEDLLGLLPAQPTLLPLAGCADTLFKRGQLLLSPIFKEGCDFPPSHALPPQYIGEGG